MQDVRRWRATKGLDPRHRSGGLSAKLVSATQAEIDANLEIPRSGDEAFAQYQQYQQLSRSETS